MQRFNGKSHVEKSVACGEDRRCALGSTKEEVLEIRLRLFNHVFLQMKGTAAVSRRSLPVFQIRADG